MLEVIDSASFSESYLWFPVVPMAKPRMTQKDKTRPSDAAARYFDYRDELQLYATLAKHKHLPVPYTAIFRMPMPKDWSKHEVLATENQPHLSRPDKDNLEKGLLDALLGEDSTVWDGRVIKVWHRNPGIIILPLQPMSVESIWVGG